MQEVNFVAIIVVAIISMAIGMAWYTPKTFGKQWMKLVGLPADHKHANPMLGMLGGLVTALITAYVMAQVVVVFGATTISQGLTVGFWLWLGFAATIIAGSVLWEEKSWKLFVINGSYQLVNFLVIAAILAVWR